MNQEWNPGWPDWMDVGKQVELLLPNGDVVQGKLLIPDYGFDGEEEYPIFSVQDANGVEWSFASADKWRFKT